MTVTHHGIEKTDDYSWLRAKNWQEVMRDPGALPNDIREYLEAENSFQAKQMDDTAALREVLFAEMKARIKTDDSSVPVRDGQYAYFSKFNAGAEYPTFIRHDLNSDTESVLFDGPGEAKDHEYFSLGLMSHSPDHTHLAWAVDTNGSEYQNMRIRDLSDMVDRDEIVADVGSMAWATDSRSLVYAKVDENHRPSKVFARDFDGSESMIYEEADPRFFVGVGRTLDGRWIEISTGQNDEDEVRLLPATDLEADTILVSPRRSGHEYSVATHNHRLFILSNNDAPNFRILTSDVGRPGEDNWDELIPHRENVLISSIIVFKDWLVRLEREAALPRIVVRHLADGTEHEIDFDEEAYSLGISGGYEFDTNTLRFHYSSPSTPSQVWDYNMSNRERILRKTQEIPSGHDPKNYVVKRLHAPSTDGVNVPLTLIYHRDTPLDGSAPCLLYGYGSYGMGMPASFSANRLSLIDRGFVFCTAHIRGGDELGRNWYEQTKKSGKQRTFDDFIAAATYLAAEDYTSNGSIVAMGGSAGGLLMGAVANQAPELFAGIIAQVPFVDVLNTMLDDSLPLTPGEWSQWGNPIESVDEYSTIENYSPYDNIDPQVYPPIFALGGLTDPRVQYWEPAKWIAKLRAVADPKSFMMLRTNMGSGHFGKTGRFAYLEEVALVYAFALKCVGEA